IGADEPDDHVEGSSLAGAIGAEKADDLALLNRKRNTIHDPAPAIGFGDFAGLEDAHAGLLTADPALDRLLGTAINQKPIIVAKVGQFTAVCFAFELALQRLDEVRLPAT